MNLNTILLGYYGSLLGSHR